MLTINSSHKQTNFEPNKSIIKNVYFSETAHARRNIICYARSFIRGSTFIVQIYILILHFYHGERYAN